MTATPAGDAQSTVPGDGFFCCEHCGHDEDALPNNHKQPCSAGCNDEPAPLEVSFRIVGQVVTHDAARLIADDLRAFAQAHPLLSDPIIYLADSYGDEMDV